MLLPLLEYQEVMIRKKLKIPNEFKAGLFCFADDLRTRHKLLRFMRRMRAVGRIIDDRHAAMSLERRGELAIEANALLNVVRGIAEKRQVNGVRGQHRIVRPRN